MPCGWPFQWSVCPGYEFYTLRQGTQDHASLLSPSWWVFFYLAQNLLCLWPLLLCTKGGFISSKCTPIIFRWQFYQLLTHFSCQLPCWSKNCSFSSPTSSCKKGTLLGSWNILIPLKKIAVQCICLLWCLNTCHSCLLPHSHRSCGAMHNRYLNRVGNPSFIHIQTGNLLTLPKYW